VKAKKCAMGERSVSWHSYIVSPSGKGTLGAKEGRGRLSKQERSLKTSGIRLAHSRSGRSA